MSKNLLTFIVFMAVSTAIWAQAQINLPIDWDAGSAVNYTVTDFGNNSSSLAADPLDASNTVLKSDKLANAETWAGTTLSTPTGFASAIPFSAGNTIIKARIYSPDAGIPVMMKIEQVGSSSIFVETQAITSVANAWDTLTFDFSNPGPNLNPINFANTYNLMSIFYNFGVNGATAGLKTYYLDEIFFAGTSGGGGGTKAQINLPIDWNDSATVNYTVTDFGGSASALANDPTNASNTVLMTEKTATAMDWAGTTLSTPAGLASAIPFTAALTRLRAVVYSPDAGTPVLLKVEELGNTSRFCEVQVNTTVANSWDTLVFDFSSPKSGSPALNVSYNYNLVSIFYNFGTTGAQAGAKTYYLSYIEHDPTSGSGSLKAQIDLPISWDDSANVNYTVADFGGNVSMLVADPTNASNNVLMSEKTPGAATWAGTTLSTPAGLATAIPFSQGNTTIKAVVWSPDAGIVVRLKAEKAGTPTISVETEATVTTAAGWDTLYFDFANEANLTAPIDFNNTYDMLSIFYNFDVDGATAGSKTYYLDNVIFGNGGGGVTPGSKNITFKVDMNDYTSAFTTAYVNGTFNGWCGSCNPMTDADNDGVWELTIPLTEDSIEYKFTVDGWSDDEKFAGGEPCTKTTGGFTNRFLYLNADTTLPVVCWASCAACTGVPTVAAIKFQVDMSKYTQTTYDTVYVNGTFNGWCGYCNPMSDADGDSIWEVTITLPIGDTIQYKFTLNGWTNDEKLTEGSSCTFSEFGFTNRILAITEDVELTAVCYEYCETCDAVGYEDISLSKVVLFPNPTSNILHISFENTEAMNQMISLYDISGKLVLTQRHAANQNIAVINTNVLEAGIYFIKIENEKEQILQKVIITK